MAKPPVKSVVLKTPRPTQAQAVQAARAQQAKFAAGLPDPRVMPSRKMVNPYGATVGSASAPVKVNRNGLVKNPSNSLGALTSNVPAHPARPAAPKRPQAAKVKVVVHPSGKIEIHHGAPASSAPTRPTSPTAAAGTFNASHPGSNPGGPIDPVPTRAKAAHVRATSAAASGLGVARPQQTIEQQAQGILDPVKQSILDAINQRVNAQQSAITAYAKDLAGMMGQYGPAAAAGYSNATQGQAAIDAALAQTLQGAGASGQAGLAAKLAQIDADPGTTARITGDAAQATQGAVGAAAGRGSASLSQLLGQKANAQDYGAKLPSVAGLYGLQATKSAQAQGTTDTANAVAQLEQQLPSIIQQLKTNGTQQQQIRFERGAALLQANGGIVTPEIRRLLGGALPTGATAKAKQDAAKTRIAQQNADTSATNAQTSAANARVNAAYKQAMLGLQDRKLQAAVAKEHSTAKAKGEHLGLSAKDWQQQNSLALAGARAAHNGTPDGSHPPISWQQYLTIGLGQKIPIGILIGQGKKVYSQAEIRQGLIPGGK